jgi:hypothetical protein
MSVQHKSKLQQHQYLTQNAIIHTRRARASAACCIGLAFERNVLQPTPDTIAADTDLI